MAPSIHRCSFHGSIHSQTFLLFIDEHRSVTVYDVVQYLTQFSFLCGVIFFSMFSSNDFINNYIVTVLN